LIFYFIKDQKIISIRCISFHWILALGVLHTLFVIVFHKQPKRLIYLAIVG